MRVDTWGFGHMLPCPADRLEVHVFLLVRLGMHSSTPGSEPHLQGCGQADEQGRLDVKIIPELEFHLPLSPRHRHRNSLTSEENNSVNEMPGDKWHMVSVMGTLWAAWGLWGTGCAPPKMVARIQLQPLWPRGTWAQCFVTRASDFSREIRNLPFNTNFSNFKT